jgi:DNA-binding NarL/FixJ family response regulator
MSGRRHVPNRPRVLLAEDHPGVSRAICRLLANDCDVVGCVASGAAVLRAAQQLQPDVIVMDVNLPELHGFDACREVKRWNPDAKVIMVSAMNEAAFRQRSLEVGAAAFLSKGTGDLLSTVKRLCEVDVD